MGASLPFYTNSKKILMEKITEVRTDHVDDENLQHIDAWFSEDENAEGKTIAVVDRDTKKVIFFDNRFRLDEKVKEAITEVLEGITIVNHNKTYSEKELFEIIADNDWSATICNNEPEYPLDTIQIALEDEGDYFGEFVGIRGGGLFSFNFYVENIS